MTPVREALEKPMIVGAVYDTERGPATYHGLDHYIGETTHKFELGNGGSVFIRQQQLDEFLKRAFATPGEPCAWRIRFKNFDEVTTDPAKAERWRKVYPDQKVDPLYTTPQPAAGWDKAAGYAERLTVALWEKHFKNDAPQWKPLSGDLIGLLTQIDNMTTALRREAPAPAESMRSLTSDEQDGINRALLASGTVIDARPDTAETRLREALEQIKSSIDTRLNNVLCEMEPGYDDSIVGFNEAWDIVRKFLREKIESLSPPSGGDEAKESDLGCMADFSPGDPANLKELLASEPSPPADRREIVARTLSTKFPAILAQYSQYKIAEAILAALAQSDDASRKREG